MNIPTPSQLNRILRPQGCIAALLLCAAGHALAQAGLTLTDIANPVAGTVVTNPDQSFTITAGGGDTYGTADSFTYMYEQRTGDFDVKVQVPKDVETDDPADQQKSAKASLHLRSNLTPGSPDIQINATPSGGSNYIETIVRYTQGGETGDPPQNVANFRTYGGPYPGTFRTATLYPVWLRMKRSGNLVQTMCSQDNRNWMVLAEYAVDPAAFPATVYLGVAAVSHNEGAANANHRVHSTFTGYQNVAAVPTPVDAGGNAVPAGQLPGTYPVSTVTGVNWVGSIPEDGLGRDLSNANPSTIVWNTGGFGTVSRDMLLSIGGNGPVAFSCGRYASGALDFGIGPADAVASQANLGPYSNASRDRDSSAITDNATHAWFPSPRYGVLLPTTRVNGKVSWNDGAAPFYPHSFQAIDSSSTRHFDMDSGMFSGGVFYTRMGKRCNTAPHPNPSAGSSGGFQRATFDMSIAWFPYAQGWKAGSFADASENGAAYWTRPASHSAAASEGAFSLDPNSAAALLKWTNLGTAESPFYAGFATLALPGVNANTDGMLFMTGNDDTTNRGPQVNCSPKADGTGWSVAVRSVIDLADPGSSIGAGSSEFSFVYVPYTALNLVGGQIAGGTGAKVHSTGTFTVTRTAAGRYQIAIPGKTGTDGMLILQAVGNRPDDATLVDNASLTYSYTDGAFVVESREIAPGAIDLGNDGVYDDYVLRDSDFYFTWVDFTQPLTLSTPVAPEVSIVRSGSSVTLSWPAAVTGYVLETSSDLTAASWTAVPGVVNNSVTLPLTPAVLKQFFRLRSTP